MSPFIPFGLGRHLIPTNTSVATSQHQPETILLSIEILLRKVRVLSRVAHQHSGIAFVDKLDRLVLAGDNGQHVVVKDELGGIDLVALRGRNNGSTVELAVVLLLSVQISVG